MTSPSASRANTPAHIDDFDGFQYAVAGEKRWLVADLSDEEFEGLASHPQNTAPWRRTSTSSAASRAS